MEIVKITNHDVLSDHVVMSAEDEGIYVLHNYKGHVGNNRFSVMIDMYREAFEMSETRGQKEECDKIVDRIVEVVCHKNLETAVNRGRFLTKIQGDLDEGTAVWKQIDDTAAKSLVRRALSIPKLDEEDLTESMPSFDDRKRPRRRSLLRRSASESTMLLDKKKTSRNDAADIFSGLFDEDDDEDEVDAFPPANTFVTYDPMDVILDESRCALGSTNNVGNNRLQVMLTLQGKNYPELSYEEQTKTATDLVRAVRNYWGGRILVENGVSSYVELSLDQCVEAMKALLSPEPIALDSIPRAPFPRPAGLLTRHQSLSFLNNGTPSANLNPDAQNLQSAAVKSLQKRKTKRVLAKKLGQGGGGGGGPGNGIPVLGAGQLPPTFIRLNNLDTQNS